MSDLPHQTSTDLLVLHTLRCIGFSGPARVAAATGLSESDAESELIDLAVATRAGPEKPMQRRVCSTRRSVLVW